MQERDTVYIVICGNYRGVGKSLDEACQDYYDETGESPVFQDSQWYKAEPIKVSLNEVVIQTLTEE